MTTTEALAACRQIRACGFQPLIVPHTEDGEVVGRIVRVNQNVRGVAGWVTDLYEDSDVDSFLAAYAENNRPQV